jgi:hypothetical protein
MGVLRLAGELVVVYPLVEVAQHHGEEWAANQQVVGAVDLDVLAVCVARSGLPGMLVEARRQGGGRVQRIRVGRQTPIAKAWISPPAPARPSLPAAKRRRHGRRGPTYLLSPGMTAVWTFPRNFKTSAQASGDLPRYLRAGEARCK